MTRPDRLAALVGWTMAALGIAHVLATSHYEPGLGMCTPSGSPAAARPWPSSAG